jgi:hypothetical protein
LEGRSEADWGVRGEGRGPGGVNARLLLWKERPETASREHGYMYMNFSSYHISVTDDIYLLHVELGAHRIKCLSDVTKKRKRKRESMTILG